MDPHVRYGRAEPGKSPTSRGGLRDFISNHLGSTKEAGVLKYARSYLTKDGQVRFRFLDPELWFRVGLTLAEYESGILPQDLIEALCNGRDRWGRPLFPRSVRRFMAPSIAIATAPTEVSEILTDYAPEESLSLADGLADVFHHQVSALATRRSNGPRSIPYSDRVKPLSGRPLLCYVPHATNRLGEPELHDHFLIWAPVLCADGIFRCFSPRSHIRHLQWNEGRGEFASVIANWLLARGNQVISTRGRRLDHPAEPAGWTIIRPDRSVIEAGSIVRQRSVEIYARRILVRTFGGGQVSPNEKRWLQRRIKAASALPEQMHSLITSFQETQHNNLNGVDPWSSVCERIDCPTWLAVLMEAAEWALLEHPGRMGLAIRNWILRTFLPDGSELAVLDSLRGEVHARVVSTILAVLGYGRARGELEEGESPPGFAIRAAERNGWLIYQKKEHRHDLSNSGRELFHRLGWKQNFSTDIAFGMSGGNPYSGLPLEPEPIHTDPGVHLRTGLVREIEGHLGPGDQGSSTPGSSKDLQESGSRPESKAIRPLRCASRSFHSIRRPVFGVGLEPSLDRTTDPNSGVSFVGRNGRIPHHHKRISSIFTAAFAAAGHKASSTTGTGETSGGSGRSQDWPNPAGNSDTGDNRRVGQRPVFAQDSERRSFLGQRGEQHHLGPIPNTALDDQASIPRPVGGEYVDPGTHRSRAERTWNGNGSAPEKIWRPYFPGRLGQPPGSDASGTVWWGSHGTNPDECADRCSKEFSDATRPGTIPQIPVPGRRRTSGSSLVDVAKGLGPGGGRLTYFLALGMDRPAYSQPASRNHAGFPIAKMQTTSRAPIPSRRLRRSW